MGIKRIQRKIKNDRQDKAEGSSIYIFIPMVFLFTVIFFYLNVYMRAADTVSDNLKSSLDSSTLSATIVNMDQLITDGKLQINGYATASATWNPQVYTDTDGKTWTEQSIMIQRFISFEKSLQSNVGLKDDFSFQGGTCGWAADFIGDNKNAKRFAIDSFIVYDIVDNNVVSYSISNVSAYTARPVITKAVVGSVTKGPNNKVITSTAKTPENVVIKEPTIYAKVSFPVKEASIFADPTWVGPELASQSSSRSFRVSKSSTTKIKSN